MLTDAKRILRINQETVVFNDEIQDLIDGAKADLLLSGVVVIDEIDPLIKRAISIYVKANFGFDNPDAEKLQKSYNLLKTHLCLASDYNGGDV